MKNIKSILIGIIGTITIVTTIYAYSGDVKEFVNKVDYVDSLKIQYAELAASDVEQKRILEEVVTTNFHIRKHLLLDGVPLIYAKMWSKFPIGKQYAPKTNELILGVRYLAPDSLDYRLLRLENLTETKVDTVFLHRFSTKIKE